MPADRLEHEIDRVLAGFSHVEPRPEMVRRWMQPPIASPRRRLPIAMWAVLAAAILILTVLAWYRSRSLHLAEPTLAGRHTALVAVKPSSGGSVNSDQQKLLKMLQSNPAALAKQAPVAPAQKPRG